AAAKVEGSSRRKLTAVAAAGGENFLDMAPAGAEELLERFRGELAAAIALIGQNPEVRILLSPGLPLSIAGHRGGGHCIKGPPLRRPQASAPRLRRRQQFAEQRRQFRPRAGQILAASGNDAPQVAER